MWESMSLQKNRLRYDKNVIFSLLIILVDKPMEGVETSPPPPAYALGDYNSVCYHTVLFKLLQVFRYSYPVQLAIILL